MIGQFNHPMQNSVPGYGFGGIKNEPINCVLEPTYQEGGLFIGDLESVSNHFHLQNNQIGAIITVSRELSNLSFPPNIKHLVLPSDDNNMYDLSKFFAEAIEFIIQSRKFTNVLVHCRMGASRSATIILAYLMKEIGMTLTESFSFLKEKRWKVNPNHGFMNQLRQFERFIHSRRRTMSIGGGFPFPLDQPNLNVSVAGMPMGVSHVPYYNWY